VEDYTIGNPNHQIPTLGIRESEGLLFTSNPQSVTGYTFYQPMKRGGLN